MPGITSSTHIELQERDWQILRGLFESRIMTAAHASALYFEGRPEAAKKRLQKLKAAGLIAERPRLRPYDPAILFLSRQAFRLLSENGRIEDYPKLQLGQMEKRARVSELTLKHELAVMDVKAAVVAAITKLSHLRVAEFSTWPLLRQFRSRPSTGGKTQWVRPDGFIRIHQHESGGTSEHAFFLEVDRSTETLDTLAIRCLCYREHYRAGGFAAQMGHAPSEAGRFPFRVLIVCKTEQRRRNLATRLLQQRPPVFTQVWLATFEEVIPSPLGSVWSTPKDYRDLTRNTRPLIIPHP
jgi:hypothetical protein